MYKNISPPEREWDGMRSTQTANQTGARTLALEMDLPVAHLCSMACELGGDAGKETASRAVTR